MRFVLAASLLTLVFAATTASSAPARAGLHGYVTRGPITPVCPGNAPCDEPAAGVTLTFTRTDGRRVRAVTRSTGFYRVALPPGRYTASADVRAPQTFSVRTARVLEGRDGRVDFHIDTGIQ